MAQSILVEVRPRLESFNISLLLLKNDPVEFKENELVINKQIVKFSGLEFNNREVLKYPTKNKFIVFKVKFNNFYPNKKSFHILESPFSAQTSVSIKCLCGFVIADKAEFSRVLPLPSSQWDASDAFCHGGKVKKNDFKTYDCLYASHFIQVSNVVVKISDENCPSCSAVLGLKFEDYFQFWMSNVDFGQNKTPKQQLLDILNDIISEPLIIISKVLLYSNNQFLTIIVLEKDLKIYRCNDIVESTDLRQESVLKVIYSFHSSKDDKIMEWLSNNDVHSIEVSTILLGAINDLLDKSHKEMHTMFNSSENEKLAYI